MTDGSTSRLGPTEELRRHNAIVPLETVTWQGDKAERSLAERVVDQTTLDWLHSRGLLTGAQRIAGVTFAREWRAAGYDPLQTIPPDHIPGSRGPVRGADRQLDAAQAVKNAVEHLGITMGHVVIRVCAGSLRLNEIERGLSWPGGVGAVMLRTALDMLERHYRERKERE